MKLNYRSGSALLIVLGMLSFMVVSAIGFSVFMRQNRLPSSFVRRNTTSHQLLKAALARAMNELDSAIGKDPFPGVDSEDSHNAKPLKGSDNNYIDDTWKGRVFVGKIRSQLDYNIDTESKNVLISSDETVSTLTMEGLAYIPPCLVNEARYFSRHTPTAQWHMLDYDAGRYAYTAINVSDYFDINKIPFAEARTYSPSNRVSLACLFRSSSGAPDPSQANNFQKEVVEKYAPFVSIADFNLVMYNQIGGVGAQKRYGFVSPFGDYATGNGRFEQYFGSADTNLIAKTTFVTDSYFPALDVSEDLLDLNEDDCQPFESLDQRNIDQIFSKAKSRKFYKTLKDEGKIELSPATFASLYDYLDVDSLPVSLALPSVEQVPVIAGFEMKSVNNVRVKVNRQPLNEGDFDPNTQSQKGSTSGETRDFIAKYTLDFEGIGDLKLDVTTLFPFKQAPCSGFEVEAAAHIFWGLDGMNTRGSSSQKSEDDLVVHGLFTEKGIVEEGGFDDFNRYTFKPASQAISGGYVNDTDDAFKRSSLSLNAVAGTKNVPFAVIKETWTYQASKDNPQNGRWVHTGSVMQGDDKINGLFGVNHNRSISEGAVYKPYLALRIRVKNSDGVVDMAPAGGWDDIHNYSKVSEVVQEYYDVARTAFIIPTSGAQIEYSVKGLQGLTGISFVDTDSIDQPSFGLEGASYVCKDPTWNHNIANWSTVSNSIKEDILATFNGQNGKDSDFFRNVSNMEWLQSISELALLPRTMTFRKGNTAKLEFVQGGRSNEADTFARSLPLTEKIAQAQGEDIYLGSSYEDDESGLESLFTDGTGGFRINPYSDDPNIFLAALSYTPYNWNAASPDNEWKFTEAIKHTFSESSDAPSARISAEEIQEIAGKMQKKFADYDDWIEAYGELGWGFAGDNDIFKDIDLTSADKKYLYGFWKGCFANRQQLFIVFLRAEPAVSSGGAGAGQGGRAVAVVWRDPKAPNVADNGNNKNKKDSATEPPHKMRVLFYKTLE